ncbi:MAG TPA: hypothetical protein VKU80_03175 [Planctomycetota bacterium]|nr:hypothetical protein [Planctomycetota bacterium]
MLISCGTLLLTAGYDGCLVVLGTWPFVLWGAWLLARKALTRNRSIH